MEQDGLDHAREDLRHVNADDLGDHLREVDAHLQGLSLDEEVVGELVQLSHDLRWRREQGGEWRERRLALKKTSDALRSTEGWKKEEEKKKA